MAMPSVGQKAPEFTLPVSREQNVSLKDYEGKKNVVLAFYPLDFTGGLEGGINGVGKKPKGIEGRGGPIFWRISEPPLFPINLFQENRGVYFFLFFAFLSPAPALYT